MQKYKKVGYNIGGALTRAITTGNKVMRSIYYELQLQLGLEHTELMQYGNLEFAKNYAVEKVGICIEVVYELPELWHNVDAKCGHSGTCSILFIICDVLQEASACQLLSGANVIKITQL